METSTSNQIWHHPFWPNARILTPFFTPLSPILPSQPLPWQPNATRLSNRNTTWLHCTSDLLLNEITARVEFKYSTHIWTRFQTSFSSFFLASPFFTDYAPHRGLMACEELILCRSREQTYTARGYWYCYKYRARIRNIKHKTDLVEALSQHELTQRRITVRHCYLSNTMI